jgi:pyruvate-ferredoxin/flavodoxin oxidoreductase
VGLCSLGLYCPKAESLEWKIKQITTNGVVMSRKMVAVDGNEATAHVAHKVSDVIAIYPITPSSPMAEHSDNWSSKDRPNIWGQVPTVVEMQSEGGAAGTVHGALQGGALTTTFTASQGLLLMIPNMYKIAGELTPAVFHVSARSLAAQALSIFGDHSDVMSCRQTGFAMLASNNVQEAQDLALVSHAATLKGRIPFMHFFDGFRTSHEVMKIEQLADEDIQALIDQEFVKAHNDRALTPDAPTMSGTAQNPDVYFQGRETVNKFYDDLPAIVQEYMDRLAKQVGRQYNVVEYHGAEDAESVVIMMGSGTDTAKAALAKLQSEGRKVGVVNIRLYRPFPTKEFLAALPASVKNVAVLDRTKEPGALGEPLFLDVVSALSEALSDGTLSAMPRVIGGRYGLSSKEFTPAMVKAVFDEVESASPKKRFTVGIKDDVTNLSLDYDPSWKIESNWFQGLFFGLGADGTVGANKNSIKIIANSTDNYAQGYFVYDSKKSGSMTTSHLRFGHDNFQAPYLIDQADFIACHHTPHLEQVDMLANAKDGATFLLNSPHEAGEVWDSLPRPVQQEIIDKKLKVYAIDGYKVGKDSGMGRRINTIMQTCFFAISGILPKDEAIAEIKKAIAKTYASKGEAILEMNNKAVDMAIDNLHEIAVPAEATSTVEVHVGQFPSDAGDFINNLTAEVFAGRGEEVPVSAMPVDGKFPTATSKWEKRDLSLEIPIWESDLCIQCGKCAVVCPHAAIRSKAYGKAELENAPETFKFIPAKGLKWDNDPQFTIQVAPLDCTGCNVCVDACPAVDKQNPGRKAINMGAQPPIKESESENWDFFINLPEADRSVLNRKTIKGSQLMQPLFEFSGACPGCGETPYLKLISQLFGDRMMVANATGCSSIYGGNLPTTPWAQNPEGKGPAWSNSLFEDNAEYGLGMRLAANSLQQEATSKLEALKEQVGADLADSILGAAQKEEADIDALRKNIGLLRDKLKEIGSAEALDLSEKADNLVSKSVWIIGGDGWAYDIGYGGLDHVLATGANVNVLVMDTEVYSNTGGQASKSTPSGAVAQFAAAGKKSGKKDIGLISMSYKNIYVGRIALGANDNHTLKTLLEAEAYEGPSLILAYSPCIAHGYSLADQLQHQKMAVSSGYWPLLRYNPDQAAAGKNPLSLDSKDPSIPVKEYIYTENRFRQLLKSDPEAANGYADQLQASVDEQWAHYKTLAGKE